MRLAEQAMAPSIATAQATPINDRVAQLPRGAGQQRGHVFGRCRGVASLELNRLTQPRPGADRDAPGARVGAQEIADEKVAAMKFLQVLVDDQSDEKVATCLFLVLGREGVEGLDQHLIGRPVADLVDKVPLGLGDGPGLTNRRAALGNDAAELELAAEGDRDATFLEHFAV
jgi:hypothetical protein